MVQILASVLSALVLSGSVFASPMMGMNAEPAMAATTSSSMMSEASTTSAAMMAETTTSSMMEAKSTSTTMMHEASTSTAMAHEAMTTSSAMMPDTTTSTAAAAATTTAAMYGSGSANWGTDLNSCVQMCQAKFGTPPSATTPPASTTVAPAAGAGATHVIIVAPKKGVLRYSPFAVNASIGDTVRFMWGAGPHTVTQSAALTVCNKSADAGAFASGQQNASFVFDQIVNTTDPTFFFCGVPTHCQKGMFGLINPPTAPPESATSVGQMMSTWTTQNPDLAKMQSAVDAMTFNTSAYNWMSNMETKSIPVEAQQSLVENIFYSRMLYAMNPTASQGASTADGSPIVIPDDVSTLLSGTAANPAGAVGAPAGSVTPGSPTGTGTAAAASSPTSTNGAKGVMTSSALIAVVAVFSSLFLI